MKFPSSVRFVPWVGSNYNKGLHGAKILILGESHYRKDGKDYSRGLNVELISGQANSTGEYPGRYAYWTKIINLVSPSDIDPHRFWNSVAYYNYIQEFVGLNPRDRPTKVMWEDAEKPFYKVLSILKPDLILTLGIKLWNSLPCDDCSEVDGERDPSYCKYIIDDHAIIAAKTRHPSSVGFNYSAGRPVVKKGIRLAIKNKSPSRRLR